MSRLSDLIAETKARNPQLGADLEREFRALSSRVPFGLNFERHRPEAVELPQRPVRRGDKVRVLPQRGTIKKGDQRLWQVITIHKEEDRRVADLRLLDAEETGTMRVAIDDLIVVAEFNDTIYPGMVSTGRIERGADRPYHTVINAENYHALKALSWSHRGKVDAIYIDPPYNTGAKDWKYNNDYVEGDDLYRHSKWLAFMERRLLLARDLLNPQNSVLIVTIDEKEYLRLGLLLEQVFPGALVQMVSATISPRSTSRDAGFSRVDEYIFFVFLGDAKVFTPHGGGNAEPIRMLYLRRTSMNSTREQGRPQQFYPIFVDPNGPQGPRIAKIGEPIPKGVPRESVADEPGLVTVWPVNPNGVEMVWGMVPQTLQRSIDGGYVSVTKSSVKHSPYTVAYVTTEAQAKVADGTYVVGGQRSDGSKIVMIPGGRASKPITVWREKAHDAGAYGTPTVTALLAGRRFPFPKSLYAVEDTLRYVVGDRRDAVILDFFAGSGTTAHAVMRLNKQDGGRRRSISVTNNEVAATEQVVLRGKGFRPGDVEWEQWGICDHITKPRIAAAITGETPDGVSIKGEYKFTDEFPMADGFSENAEFFTLTYETPVAVSHNVAFTRIAPLLWLRAGSRGDRISKVPQSGWAVVERYGLLTDLDQATPFLRALRKAPELTIVYIVTDDDRRFQAIARRLPEHVEAVRLYESYLTNFAFANGGEG